MGITDNYDSDTRPKIIEYYARTQEWSLANTPHMQHVHTAKDADIENLMSEAINQIRLDTDRNITITLTDETNPEKVQIIKYARPKEGDLPQSESESKPIGERLKQYLISKDLDSKAVLTIMNLANQTLGNTFATRVNDKIEGIMDSWYPATLFPKGQNITIKITKEKNVLLKISNILTNIIRLSDSLVSSKNSLPDIAVKSSIIYDLAKSKFKITNQKIDTFSAIRSSVKNLYESISEIQKINYSDLRKVEDTSIENKKSLIDDLERRGLAQDKKSLTNYLKRKGITQDKIKEIVSLVSEIQNITPLIDNLERRGLAQDKIQDITSLFRKEQIEQLFKDITKQPNWDVKASGFDLDLENPGKIVLSISEVKFTPRKDVVDTAKGSNMSFKSKITYDLSDDTIKVENTLTGVSLPSMKSKK